jgi:hypothetical protein
MESDVSSDGDVLLESDIMSCLGSEHLSLPVQRLVFTPDAIVCITKTAKLFEIFVSFNDFLEFHASYTGEEVTKLYDMSIFITVMEQRLSLYIVNEVDYTMVEIIDLANTVNVIRRIIRNVIGLSFDQLTQPPEISTMLNGYPELIVGKICDSTSVELPRNHIFVVKECVKRIQLIRTLNSNIIPHYVHDMMSGQVPLTGHENSPLTHKELEALYFYIGEKKQSTVHLLLNTMHHMVRHQQLLLTELNDPEVLYEIMRSGWLHVLLIGIISHKPKKKSNVPTHPKS